MTRWIAAASVCLVLLVASTAGAQASPPGADQDGGDLGVGGAGALMISGSVLMHIGLSSAQIIGFIDRNSVIDCAPGGSCPTSPKEGAPYMFVPFAGPFIAINKTGTDGAKAIFMGATGGAQLAGLAVLVAGAAWRGTEVGDQQAARTTPLVHPIIAAGSYGLGVQGRF